MKAIIFLLCFTLLSSLVHAQSGKWQRYLNSMSKIMTGNEVYNPQFFSKLNVCLKLFDSDLPSLQDVFYDGQLQIWKSRDSLITKKWGLLPIYFEKNATETDFEEMVVQQPCNTISKTAWYHTLVEICTRVVTGPKFNMPFRYLRALAQHITSYVFAGSFSHCSETIFANLLTHGIGGPMFYLIHQAFVELIPSNSSVIKYLQDTPREKDAFEVADDMKTMFLETDINDWVSGLKKQNLPSYVDFFTATAASFLAILDPDKAKVKTFGIANFIGTISPVKPTFKKFLLKSYIPELISVTESLNLTRKQQKDLMGKFNGLFIKAGYGSVFHEVTSPNKYPLEKLLKLDKKLENPFVNKLVAATMPKISTIANLLSKNKFYNQKFQKLKEVYPGEEWCRDFNPHPKYHVMEALGALDLIYLVDAFYGVFRDFFVKR